MPDARSRRSRALLWAKRALLVLFSLALSEALLRYLFTLRVLHGNSVGFGTRPEIISRLFYAYGEGRYSMLPINADMTVPDPHRGYRLKPGVRDRNVSGASVSSNSLGARGRREYASPKPPDVVRFVALGDSFTFGEGVADDATWPAHLERLLPGTEVVNFGDRGYAHDQMYFALVDDGIPLEPDAVIVGFFENDVWRDELTYYAYDKPRFTLGADGWYIENVPVPTPQELRDRYLMFPLVYAVPRALLGSLAVQAMDTDGGEERAAEIFRRMRQATEDAGARFLVVNLPDLFLTEMLPDDGADVPPIIEGFFYEYCAKTGAECIDPWPLFWSTAGTNDDAQIRARFLRPRDIHYSGEGYAVVAEAIRKHLTEHPIARTNRDGKRAGSAVEPR